VVEGARLESVFRGNSNVGSNPTLSAILFSTRYRWPLELAGQCRAIWRYNRPLCVAKTSSGPDERVKRPRTALFMFAVRVADQAKPP
jgi:hypothetical protein